MKILHIISDTVLGGAQTVCIDLANCAIKENNEVAVAAMEGGYLWQQLDSEVKQFPLKYMKKSINLDDFKVIKELKKIKKEFSPDIIHLHTSKPGILGRWVFRNNKKHIVYTVHGFDQINIAHKKFLPIEKYFQRYAGSIVAVSNYDFNNMKKEGIKNNLRLIYNGMSFSKITNADSFPVKINEKNIVLTIARIAPPKNFQLFTEVARSFENSDVAFVWIGGSKDKDLDSLKIEYNIPSNMYLLGDLPNACKYINLCNVFVLFTKHEGLGMSIIEAMAQKKAVVASNVGGIPELVSKDNGALINNVDEAVFEITQILNNKEKCLKMGEESLNKYNSNFTLEKMWNSYYELYKELLS